MIHLFAAAGEDERPAALLISLTGHVGHAPHRRDPVDAVLIGGTGVQVAEAAPRCSAGQDQAGLAIPGGLADVEAGREIPVERGAASGQHQRVGGRKADLLDRRVPEVSVAEPAVVAGAGYHRDMVSGRSQQDGVHLGHLSLGEVVFAQTEADQRHVGARDGQPQSGEHAGGRVRGAVQGIGGQQDHPENGGGGRPCARSRCPGPPRQPPSMASLRRPGWSRPGSAWWAAGTCRRMPPDPGVYRWQA
jgi:hypothetical protein